MQEIVHGRSRKQSKNHRAISRNKALVSHCPAKLDIIVVLRIVSVFELGYLGVSWLLSAGHTRTPETIDQPSQSEIVYRSQPIIAIIFGEFIE